MIRLSVGEYRSISQPFENLFGSNGVSFEREDKQTELRMWVGETELKSLREICEYIQNHFESIFPSPVNI